MISGSQIRRLELREIEVESLLHNYLISVLTMRYTLILEDMYTIAIECL